MKAKNENLNNDNENLNNNYILYENLNNECWSKKDIILVKIRVLLLAIITTGPRYFGHAVADTQPSPLFTGVCIILMVHEANKIK